MQLNHFGLKGSFQDKLYIAFEKFWSTFLRSHAVVVEESGPLQYLEWPQTDVSGSQTVASED